MSQSTRIRKGSKNCGMNSISDMFKRQNESKKKRTLNNIDKSSSSDKKMKKNDDSDSDIDIIDVELFQHVQRSRWSNKSKSTLNAHNLEYKISQKPRPNSKLSLSLERKFDSGSNSTDNYKVEKVASECANLESNDLEQISMVTDSITKAKEENDLVGDGDESESNEQNKSEPSYYQINFETILNSILGDTDDFSLFSDADHAYINSYLSLSEQAKKLYIRLFGRKFKWIPLSKIKYPEIGESLLPYLKELTNSQLISNEDSLTDLEDVLETLSAGDTKTMAKLYHVAPSVTQKKQIIVELLKICQRSTVSSMFGLKGGVNASMLKKSKALVHGAYKLQQEPRSIFIRVMMLFSLINTTGDEESGNGGQGQLFQMLMVHMGKVVYPSYKIQKKHQIFKTRQDVIRFECALQLESDLLHAIEKGNWTGAYKVYCTVSKELETLQQDKDIIVRNKSLPDFLRSFTATSVLYRLLSQGIEILQRRKEFTEAVTLTRKLLNQQSYCFTYRGYWWERLALNLDVHLKEPLQSLEAIATGLRDDYVIGGHRLALFQRAESICERPRLKLKHRLSEFHHNPVRELPKVHLEGRVLHQGVTSSGLCFLSEGSYANGNSQDLTVCGVEEFVMEHYKRNGYPCVLHAEGSIVTGLFGLFFWDVLFMPIPDAFHSLYQAQPLDLYSNTSFYSARKKAIDDRLTKLENSSCEALNQIMEETWTKEYGKLCTGLNWERLNSIDDVKGLVKCIGGKMLSGILGRYSKCPRHMRSGFPDLTLWNIHTGNWKICEVKGPGDKLSHKQILWLDYLLGLGVDAEVCHVKAVAAKKLRPST